MAITDDLRKAVTDPTPLYALAGAADAAAEKLGEVPALVEKFRAEAPERLESVRDIDPKDVQDLFVKQAKDAQEKLTELLGSLDGDLKKFREQAQDLALQGVGRAAEVAVRARETYEGLAERGRGAVPKWRGQTAEHVEELAVAIEPEPAAKSEPQSTERDDADKNRSANGTKSADDKPAGAKKTAPAARKPVAKKPTPPAAK